MYNIELQMFLVLLTTIDFKLIFVSLYQEL